MALPTNQAIAPTRNTGDLMRKTNQEQAFHPIYHYAFITDAIEGLIAVNVDTMADGEARNNFLKRAITWNPNGLLTGARHITLGGHYAYITTPKGLSIIDLDNPLRPKHIKTIALEDARASAVQFRYVFVTDSKGLHVIDITLPKAPKLLDALVPLQNAQKLYLARTYAYVAAAEQGLAIIDIEKPEAPALYQLFDAEGKLNDARDVIVGTTNASLFAYVADGKNGLKVLQLTSPDIQPKFYGFSPEPKPQVIAWSKTKSPAVAISKGLDRDRGVDETGHQIAVFGRIGARPFNRKEMEKLYLRPNGNIWTVDDAPSSANDYVPAKLTTKAGSKQTISSTANASEIKARIP
jgi:LVIVD repeat